jgi:hypothetical protein
VKTLNGPLPPLELAGLARRLNQTLDPRIAVALLEEIQHEPFLGFAELAVVEAEQHGLNQA